MRFESILRNFNLLNVVLLTTAVVFAAYILPPLLDVQAKYTLPAAKKTEEGKSDVIAEPQFSQYQEYAIVAEKNLFHPERKIPVVKAEAPPLPKPEFVLYGTLIAGDTKLAFIDDAKASQTRGKRQRALSLGSPMSGFTLSEVYQDKVVMTRGEEKIEVRVLDSSKSRTAASTAPTVKKPASVPVQPQAQPQSQEEIRKRREALRNVNPRSRGF